MIITDPNNHQLASRRTFAANVRAAEYRLRQHDQEHLARLNLRKNQVVYVRGVNTGGFTDEWYPATVMSVDPKFARMRILYHDGDGCPQDLGGESLFHLKTLRP